MQEGWTALHCAVASGHAHVTHVLLDAGARVDARQERGLTPLHFACERGDAYIARVLVQAGAAVNATDDRHYKDSKTVRPLLVWVGRMVSGPHGEGRRRAQPVRHPGVAAQWHVGCMHGALMLSSTLHLCPARCVPTSQEGMHGEPIPVDKPLCLYV